LKSQQSPGISPQPDAARRGGQQQIHFFGQKSELVWELAVTQLFGLPHNPLSMAMLPENMMTETCAGSFPVKVIFPFF